MTSEAETPPLPLSGLRVIEFTHTVMGPAAGLILADLGAEVVRVEPAPNGDPTRSLGGFAAGFYSYFNRSKRSLSVDLKSARGRALVHRLVERADVIVENFGPGTMERLGCSYADLSALNPRLVYCALKGFLPGPYEHRAALDEVVQFMGGLAYMTGPPGQPLRAGTSVIDITAGMFGVIGILAALREREDTGHGTQVTSALFETTVFLMGQHMAASAVHGQKVLPMSQRRSAWSVYQVFPTADGQQVFVGIVSDRQWLAFCEEFGRPDLAADERLRTNASRIAETSWFLPEVAACLSARPLDELLDRLDRAGVAFAPVAEVEDLFTYPHLAASGGLLDVLLEDGRPARLPRLPFRMVGHEFGRRNDTRVVGEDTGTILADLGLSTEEVACLISDGVVVGPT